MPDNQEVWDYLFPVVVKGRKLEWYKCPRSACRKTARTLAGMRQHAAQEHQELRVAAMDMLLQEAAHTSMDEVAKKYGVSKNRLKAHAGNALSRTFGRKELMARAAQNPATDYHKRLARHHGRAVRDEECLVELLAKGSMSSKQLFEAWNKVRIEEGQIARKYTSFWLCLKRVAKTGRIVRSQRILDGGYAWSCPATNGLQSEGVAA